MEAGEPSGTYESDPSVPARRPENHRRDRRQVYGGGLATGSTTRTGISAATVAASGLDIVDRFSSEDSSKEEEDARKWKREG